MLSVIFLFALLSFLQGTIPLKYLMFKFCLTLSTPCFGLKSEFSLHVRLTQMCNIIPTAAAVMSPHPPPSGRVERPNISGPIQSIKCTVVFNVLCKKNQCVVETGGPGGTWPPSLITRGGPAPFPPPCGPGGTWPPSHQRGSRPLLAPFLPPSSYQPGHWKFSLLRSSQQGWIWTVEWRFAASPAQIPCFWIMHAILSLFHLESCCWSVYQMIGCLVLIAVIF